MARQTAGGTELRTYFCNSRILPWAKGHHTQSDQNKSIEQTDLDHDLEYSLGEGDESQLPENHEGAQVGGNRSQRHMPRPGPRHNTEPPVMAYEGSVKSRAPDDADKQGVSSQSSAEENRRPSIREDARAGLDHSGRPRK